MQQTQPVIRLEQAYKSYALGQQQVHALCGVDLQVHKGEFVCVVGASGSGKSTLMNILGCLDIPTQGSYYLDGTDVSNLSDTQLAQVRKEKIGFIFQSFHLLPHLSALENVELPLLYRKIPKTTRRSLATRALGEVYLSERMFHRPSQLSGGQQQRVAIARAIAMCPPIILADEPTGNLDSRSTDTVMELILKLHREGKTIVLITHNDEIARMGDTIVRIKDGKLVP